MKYKIYITPVRRKERYKSSYKHSHTEYSLSDGYKELVKLDSIDIENENFRRERKNKPKLKRGVNGFIQLMEERGYVGTFEKVKLSTRNLNF